MKFLNKSTTEIFLKFLAISKDQNFLFECEQFMPLSLKVWGHLNPRDPRVGLLYSLGHIYQVGQSSFYDPGVLFWLHQGKELLIAPVYLENFMRVDEFESKLTLPDLVYDPDRQYDITLFANRWLLNIWRNGYLK